MSDCRIRIAGHRLKDGKLVPDVRRLSVSQRLRQARSTTVRSRGRAQVSEMPTLSDKPSFNGLARSSAEDARLVPILL